MADRQGVEIDYCPQCRGVWLDRGELDKIIERSDAQGGAPAPQSRNSDRRDDRGYDGRSDDRTYEKRPKKKKGLDSLLGDIFDF